ncbi:MAG: 50S ribosomal protein L4 [Nanoarchaeota archaeon]|nr:50S ribosomal protein L4 [Nanoarchaeota archaeon]
MKLSILNISKEEIGKQEMPAQFNEEIRPDLIKRAVISIQGNTRQAYGADPMAGKRASAKLSRRRHSYKTAYGIGISRVPRKIMSSRGTRMNWVGAFAPGTVGGRKAHPPKAGKDWTKKINKKERRKAIRSAIAATLSKELVGKNHIIPANYPFIIESRLESLKKTKEVKDVLKKIGLEKELERVSEKTIRSGKGKKRGRKYKTKVGPLIIVSKDCNLIKAAKNIAGINVRIVKSINAKLLAPSASPGRLTIWTQDAVKELGDKKLFM